MKTPTVICIVGPTAAGKSKVALALAQKLKGEIISADSMQVYQGMDIGTAKPSFLEQKKIPHHLIDIVRPAQKFSVFQFRKKALNKIKEVTRKGKVPIIVGGTGLYVRALLEGLSSQPGQQMSLRKSLEKEAKEKGREVLYQRLQKMDPDRASKIRPQDLRRIIRALEIIETAGSNPTDIYEAPKVSIRDLGFEPKVIGITMPREELYATIEKRVEQMFRKGLLQEVEKLAQQKLSQTASQAVGYKELLPLFRSELSLKDHRVKLKEAKDLIKRNTRRLAKRQLTWFRREKEIVWFEHSPNEKPPQLASKILSKISL